MTTFLLPNLCSTPILRLTVYPQPASNHRRQAILVQCICVLNFTVLALVCLAFKGNSLRNATLGGSNTNPLSPFSLPHARENGIARHELNGSSS